VKKILLKKSDSTPQHTLGMEERRRASTGSHYADLSNMSLRQPVVNHPVAFSSNKPEPSVDCIYSNSGIPKKPRVHRHTVDELTIASFSNPMVMNSHQLLMQQMAKLKQQQAAIQQMQQQIQLQKDQELRRYVTNYSSLALFDTTKTGQDEVPEELWDH
jgi:hypothetical protein